MNLTTKMKNIQTSLNRHRGNSQSGFHKNEDGSEELETSHFNIRSYGKMAEVFKDKCTVGRGIRVVGRLKEENSKVFIIAEHIELKPNVKKA